VVLDYTQEAIDHLPERSTFALSSIAAMGGVLLLFTIKVNHWFNIFIPLFVTMRFIGLWLSMNMFKEKKYIMPNKLMRE
jgi:hypothetical protein